MGFNQDNLGRMILADNADRTACIGGDPTKLGGKSAPILYARAFRAKGSTALFAHERAAGHTAVADDEAWVSFNHLGAPPESVRTDAEGKLWMPGDGACVDHHVWWDTGSGAEWEMHLKAEPNGGLLPLSVKMGAGLQAFHQPALMPEELAAGDFRPADVVDSFAIYGSKHGNWNDVGGRTIAGYMAGKVGHLYRPWFVDSGGEKHWCKWETNDGRIVGIRVPVGMAYPGVLGPTFGYYNNGTAGASSSNPSTGNVDLFGAFACPESGTVTAIGLYFNSTNSRSVTLGIYASGPAGLLGNSAGGTMNAVQWYSQNLGTPVSVTAMNYWLACEQNNDSSIKYDTGAASFRYEAHTYSAGTMLADASSSSLSNSSRNYSIYATYTASSTGHPSPHRFIGVPYVPIGNRGRFER